MKCMKIESPNLIEGLTPCQIPGKLTSQTKKDTELLGKKRRWQVKNSTHKFRAHVARKNLFLSDFYKVTQETIWTYLRSFMWKLGKVMHHFCIMFGNSKNEDSITARGLVPRRFGEKEGRKAVYFSLVSPLDKNPEKTCKPYNHMKEYHDVLYEIDLRAAQETLDFYQTANWRVLCYDTVPAEFLIMVVNSKDGSLRSVKNDKHGSPPKNRTRERSKESTSSNSGIEMIPTA